MRSTGPKDQRPQEALVRRLLTAVLAAIAAGVVGATAAAAQPTSEPAGEPSEVTEASQLVPVDVFEVSGLLDAVMVDEIGKAIDRAAQGDAQALILQMNSRGAVVSRSEMARLAERVHTAEVPIAIWVGPSGARAYGLPAQLLAVADVTGMAPGTRIGRTGTPLIVPGAEIDFGQATAELRSGTLGFQDARRLGALKLTTSDEGVPVLRNMVFALDGLAVGGVVLDTVVERLDDDGTVVRDATTVRFSKLGAVPRLLHTVASPPVAYLLITIGLALLIFEFFTAGVGVAGLVGAVSAVLGSYGLGALPTRSWAIALLILAMLALAVDVQVGIPRFWTGLGLVLFAVASWTLFPSIDGATLRPSWITLVTGIGGTALAFIVGMPSVVRTRFATPTIGREWMVGELATAVEAIDPEGIVRLSDATWRARTNRATPIPAGAVARVVAIDGITLEVEPEEGAARDYRERRSKGADPQA
jgi:membrane-bound serine protease (ClpP class)